MQRGILFVLVGVLAAIAATPASAREYVPNGSFEGSLSGWTGYNASLSLVSGGVSGTRAARVLRRGSSNFSIWSPTPFVSSTVAGRTYTGRAWIRSDRPNKTACIRIREWSSGRVVGSALDCLKTSSSWRAFDPVAYTAKGNGRQLDVYVYQASSGWGDRFDVDAISLTDPSDADTMPPDTRIDSGPSGTTTSTSASFTFSATESARFECSLDGAAYTACTSPKSYSALTPASHTFRVRAIDTAGNVDATPAERSWTVMEPADTTPPETTIVAGPAATTTATEATFSFTADETSTFACSLDGAAYTACTSPKTYTGVAVGTHTFRVRATDTAGNTDPTPAEQSWTVEEETPASPPETTISSGPTGTVRTATHTFAFSSDQRSARFECSLDGAAFTSCPSPVTIDVGKGSHTLRVRAVSAGGTDETPAERSWWADPLLANGNFETSLVGWRGRIVPSWTGYNATLSLVAGGVAGPTAARVTYAPDPTATSFSMYANPRALDTTEARTYTVEGSVRSEVPGDTVCLFVREYTPTKALVGTRQSCVAATTSWQPFAPVAYVASAGNELDVYVAQVTAATSGDSFDVDGLTISDGRPVQVPPLPPAEADPVLLAFADAAVCYSSGDDSVSRLLDVTPGIVTIAGDTEQNDGGADEFAGCYDPVFGRHKARTRPAVGDHEYRTPGATPYYDYFGAAAGPSGKGWYSYNAGNWHVVVLNSNCDLVGGCGPGSEQYEWLRQDLAANAKPCTAAYYQHPRWSSGYLHGSQQRVSPFWTLFYEYSVDFAFSGNDHNYQRFAELDPAGNPAPGRGTRQFVVGTGGAIHYRIDTPAPNVEAWNADTFGVLKLTLRDDSYDWRFLPVAGMSYTDSGSTACSPLPPRDTQAPTVALTSPAEGATVGGTVAIAADASDAVGVTKVEFRVNDVVVATDTTAPYEYQWDTRTVGDGPAAVSARAVDEAGNAATSTRNVTVRNGAPQTTIDGGPSGTATTGDATFTFSADVPGSTFECSLDGAAFAPCTSPKAYTGLADGAHVFEVRAKDANGTVDPTPARREWTVATGGGGGGENLIANSSFESSLDGWRGYNATLALVTGGAVGAQAARVTGSTASFSMYPSPRHVITSDARTYRASAWLKSDAVGRTLCIRIREWAGATAAGGAHTCVTATGAWQQTATVSYTAAAGNQLEVYAYMTGVAGEWFDVDGIELR